jgi:hypothetical protein
VVEVVEAVSVVEAAVEAVIVVAVEVVAVAVEEAEVEVSQKLKLLLKPIDLKVSYYLLTK